MNAEDRDLLHHLLSVRAPSGAEQAIQRFLEGRLQPVAHRIETDLHGNLFAGIHLEQRPRIMLASHCDQVGLMISYIDPDGFLFVEEIGGVDESVLAGARVSIATKDGPLPGVIGKKATHLESKKERDTVPTLKQIWIDVGARSREEAEKLITLGDYVTFDFAPVELKNDLIASPALDDRAGVFVALQAFHQCAQAELCAGLFIASTVQEELGMRGASTAAHSIKPDIAIVIDVVNATDDPGHETKCAPCKLGSGPTISVGPNTNPKLGAMLVEIARREKIPYQIAPTADLEGNDAKVIQAMDSGVATATIGIPNRNMHSQVEVCSMIDIEHATRLVSAFIRSVDGKVDFRPLHFDR